MTSMNLHFLFNFMLLHTVHTSRDQQRTPFTATTTISTTTKIEKIYKGYEINQ